MYKYPDDFNILFMSDNILSIDCSYGMTHYYHINLNTKNVLEVGTQIALAGDRNDDALYIYKNPKDDNLIEIKNLIEDNCTKDKIAFLKDITVNDVPQNILNSFKKLNCVEGDTDLYLYIKYAGISDDLSKIYFYVYETNGTTDIIFQKDYYFDLSTNTVKEGKPNNLLKIENN